MKLKIEKKWERVLKKIRSDIPFEDKLLKIAQFAYHFEKNKYKLKEANQLIFERNFKHSFEFRMRTFFGKEQEIFESLKAQFINFKNAEDKSVFVEFQFPASAIEGKVVKPIMARRIKQLENHLNQKIHKLNWILGNIDNELKNIKNGEFLNSVTREYLVSIFNATIKSMQVLLAHNNLRHIVLKSYLVSQEIDWRSTLESEIDALEKRFSDIPAELALDIEETKEYIQKVLPHSEEVDTHNKKVRLDSQQNEIAYIPRGTSQSQEYSLPIASQSNASAIRRFGAIQNEENGSLKSCLRKRPLEASASQVTNDDEESTLEDVWDEENNYLSDNSSQLR